jgi:hypothetical protein
LRFDGSASERTVSDASGEGNDLLLSREAERSAAPFGSAIVLDESIETSIAESPSLDLLHFTIELWIRPESIPGQGRAGLLDNNGQYGFFIQAGGQLSCSAGPAVKSQQGAIVARQWQHVACRYDGQDIAVFVDGALQASETIGEGIQTGGNDGTAVGQNSPSGDDFRGEIGDLRVFDRAVDSSLICSAAGRTDC